MKQKRLNIIIANLFGQDDYGYKGKVYIDIKALEKCFTSLANIKQEKCTFITNKDIIKIAIPYKIGCCRGGEDWNKVYKLIKDLFKDNNDVELQIWKYDK
jgi:hypothetical protein